MASKVALPAQVLPTTAPATAIAIAIHTSAISSTPSTSHGPLLSKEVKLDELSKYFHLPEKAVAKELGICLTSLKKLCRSYGITRWPFRKLKSLERTMRKVQTVRLASCLRPCMRASCLAHSLFMWRSSYFLFLFLCEPLSDAVSLSGSSGYTRGGGR